MVYPFFNLVLFLPDDCKLLVLCNAQWDLVKRIFLACKMLEKQPVYAEVNSNVCIFDWTERGG